MMLTVPKYQLGDSLAEDFEELNLTAKLIDLAF